MPSGAGVIEYRGQRGRTFRIKFTDSAGRQTMETLGAERDGWTRRKAEAELRERLVRVERQAYRRPGRVTFSSYATTWFARGKITRAWKPRTVLAYRRSLERLEETFAPMPLATIRPSHVAEHVRTALEAFAAKTVTLDLNVLHDVFKAALVDELVQANPVEGVERPKVRRKRWRILTPAEVGAVRRAFTDERARTAFVMLMLTGIRRFELQALRWRDVDLVEMTLRVSESKSEEGERSIALSPTLAEALWQHQRRSAFQGEAEYVFAHPERGSGSSPSGTRASSERRSPRLGSRTTCGRSTMLVTRP